MKRLTILATLLFAAVSVSAQDYHIKLWDNTTAPTSNGVTGDEYERKPGTLTNTSSAEIWIYKPAPEKATGQAIDNEARKILKESMASAVAMLEANREKMVKIAELLLERETITSVDMENICGKRKGRDPSSYSNIIRDVEEKKKEESEKKESESEEKKKESKSEEKKKESECEEKKESESEEKKESENHKTTSSDSTETEKSEETNSNSSEKHSD